MSETWWEYVNRVTRRAPQVEIARAAAVDPASVSRWKLGKNTPSAESVIKLARHYNRNPVEALTVASYLGSNEVAGVVELGTGASGLANDQLLTALAARLSLFEQVKEQLLALDRAADSLESDAVAVDPYVEAEDLDQLVDDVESLTLAIEEIVGRIRTTAQRAFGGADELAQAKADAVRRSKQRNRKAGKKTTVAVDNVHELTSLGQAQRVADVDVQALIESDEPYAANTSSEPLPEDDHGWDA